MITIIRRMLSWLVGAAITLVFAAVIYVTLSMGVTEETLNAQANETPRPYVKPVAITAPVERDVNAYFPYPCAFLSEEAGAAESEQAFDVMVEGQSCRVIERIYVDEQGHRIAVRSATPAVYMTTVADCKLTEEAYTVEGMTAQYLVSDTRDLLLMRSGEVVYLAETQDGKEALLRAAAYLAFE